MVSSKLKAKSVDRTTLYFNKFEYRVVLISPNMYYSWNCKTIDDYRTRIAEACSDYDSNKSFMRWRPKPLVEDWEYELIEKILNLGQKYIVKKDLSFRREHTKCAIYTSNTNIIKEILSFAPDAKITQVSLMPTGVMTFKRDPPAKYRAYMTNIAVSDTFKEEMAEYLARTPDVKPSDALYTFLHRLHKYPRIYLWDSYYVDYNDDKNLMMMTLMFPGAIGKRYKLEKKTD